MPANLTPQYQEAERRYKAAKSPEEKLEALEEMIAVIPKHKGTEKLQADLKKKLSQVRAEKETRKGPARRESISVAREGARQLALVGSPNCGKSLLIRRLTRATPEVADYPFTTRLPTPGMMSFENVRFQLIDLPPVSAEHMETWQPPILRSADAILWVINLSDDNLLESIDEVTTVLRAHRIELEAARTLVVANQSDAPGAAEREAIAREVLGASFQVHAISALQSSDQDLESFKRAVYDFLNVIRVFTRAPGKKVDLTSPYVLDKGSTVWDVAGKVHRDLQDKLKYARIWTPGKPDGIMVPRDHVLGDSDVVELHTE